MRVLGTGRGTGPPYICFLCPTAEDFRAMGPGDNVIITPPPSKADQWAMVWGASPIYLAWGPEPRNACRALAAMELGDMVTGEERSRAPLFSPGGGAAFTGFEASTCSFFILAGTRIIESRNRLNSLNINTDPGYPSPILGPD
jgi:hypothetical protein